jgi:hypothetical protein
VLEVANLLTHGHGTYARNGGLYAEEMKRTKEPTENAKYVGPRWGLKVWDMR